MKTMIHAIALMKTNPHHANTAYKRAIFTLPKKVVAELERFARIVRGGNKSGFVADAIQAYITHLRKVAHTRKLRASYATLAKDSLAIAQEWELLSDEVWAKLQETEQ